MSKHPAHQISMIKILSFKNLKSFSHYKFSIISGKNELCTFKRSISSALGAVDSARSVDNLEKRNKLENIRVSDFIEIYA